MRPNSRFRLAAGTWLGSATGAFIGLSVGLAMVGGSYCFSDRLAIRAAGARPLTEAEAPLVYEIVRSLVDRTELPMPAIYLAPSLQPNAFATGRDPEHAAVCVTEGILPLLDRDELEGVLAHEMSHVVNHDILVGSIAAAQRTPMNIDPAQATAYIINPLSGRRIQFGRMFRTQPPTIDRIARLDQSGVTTDHIGAQPETSAAR